MKRCAEALDVVVARRDPVDVVRKPVERGVFVQVTALAVDGSSRGARSAARPGATVAAVREGQYGGRAAWAESPRLVEPRRKRDGRRGRSRSPTMTVRRSATCGPVVPVGGHCVGEGGEQPGAPRRLVRGSGGLLDEDGSPRPVTRHLPTGWRAAAVESLRARLGLDPLSRRGRLGRDVAAGRSTSSVVPPMATMTTREGRRVNELRRCSVTDAAIRGALLGCRLGPPA